MDHRYLLRLRVGAAQHRQVFAFDSGIIRLTLPFAADIPHDILRYASRKNWAKPVPSKQRDDLAQVWQAQIEGANIVSPRSSGASKLVIDEAYRLSNEFLETVLGFSGSGGVHEKLARLVLASTGIYSGNPSSISAELSNELASTMTASAQRFLRGIKVSPKYISVPALETAIEDRPAEPSPQELTAARERNQARLAIRQREVLAQPGMLTAAEVAAQRGTATEHASQLCSNYRARGKLFGVRDPAIGGYRYAGSQLQGVELKPSIEKLIQQIPPDHREWPLMLWYVAENDRLNYLTPEQWVRENRPLEALLDAARNDFYGDRPPGIG